MQIAICDDDEKELSHLSDLIAKYGVSRGINIDCHPFHNGIDFLSTIKGGEYDLVLLDVIMPGENGINVAREIRQYDDTVKIIFLTSSAEFAVESYTVGAYYYQMKPICEKDFFQLMDSAISDCEKAQQCSLILHCKGGITRINLRKLEYCEIIGHTLVFHLENGKIVESIGSLDELYSKIAQYGNFLRPHRSFIINMEYIQNISYKAIIMDNLAEIPIPHGKCSEIKNRYLEYAFDRKQVFLS